MSKNDFELVDVPFEDDEYQEQPEKRTRATLTDKKKKKP